MCGRFTREYTWAQVRDFLDLRMPTPAEMRPSWNVAPAQAVPVCRAGPGGERELVFLRWGFRPAWMRGEGPAPINARSETAASSPMFREAVRSGRCVVPATGFYEWQAGPSGRKRPMLVRYRGHPLFGMAGLWTPGREAGEPGTFAVLTTAPNAALAAIHDRMPVMLTREGALAWLSGAPAEGGLLGAAPAADMEIVPVSTRVNRPSVDDPRLVEPAPEDPEPTLF